MAGEAADVELVKLIEGVPSAVERLTELQNRRKVIAADRRENKKAIRNEIRKKRRLMKNAKKLSREDLLQVLVLQMNARP